MTKEKSSSQNAETPIRYSQTLNRVYFNRFNFSKMEDAMCVRVWLQDDLMRVSNAYAFLISNQDFAGGKSGIRNYLQRIMQDMKAGHVGDACEMETFPDVFSRIDNVRVVICSRSGDRAEIYLGYYPLAMNVASTSVSERWNEILLDVALCSNVGCHVKLMRKLVEE